MKKLLIIVVFTFICIVSAKSSAPHFGPPFHFGNANFYGEADIYFLLDEVPYQDETIPIYAVFNSNTKRRSPYLAQNWYLPFLEARAEQLAQGLIKVKQLPGNGNIQQLSCNVNYFNKRENNYYSLDSKWKGIWQDGDFSIETTDPGWQIFFEKGKIKEIKSLAKGVISWTRKNDDLDVTINGKQAVKVLWAPEVKAARALVINGKKYEFKYTEDRLIEISYPDGSRIEFLYSSPEPNVMKMQIIGSASSEHPVFCSWHKGTGHILEDDKGKYSISIENRSLPIDEAVGRTFLRPETNESFSYKDGVVREVFSDGRTITTKIDSGAGPAFMTKSTEEHRSTSEIFTIMYKYDKHGNMTESNVVTGVVAPANAVVVRKVIPLTYWVFGGGAVCGLLAGVVFVIKRRS